ncbi:hypothetical protein MN116_008738 [Schistosoma mekongi]|uniref:Survival motor neuron Tudor domain-containing protein n=1 Tax=Schistosoma mekongi TaxID=38744 RepID=A0AAE2D1L7_SCHME|nr:hypothetical protein MN116_008738 [Schistosoma mekongi]
MDLSNTSKQIWPPVNVDADDEAFWDDKDLIDEYNRIESVVKDRLTLEIDKKKKFNSFRVNNSKTHGNLIKDSFSICNNFKEKNTDFIDCQSFDGNDNPVCDLQWIPPCTNPPAQLFSRLASSSDDCFSDKNIQSNISPKSIHNINTEDHSNIETILYTWYEAGYQLGRSHAKKLKFQST